MFNFQNIKTLISLHIHFKDFKDVKLFLSFYVSGRYCKNILLSFIEKNIFLYGSNGSAGALLQHARELFLLDFTQERRDILQMNKLW